MTDKTLGEYIRYEKPTPDDAWLDARYAAACKAVGRGTVGASLDPITIFMTGSDWERKHAAEQSELVPEWPADDMDGGVATALIEKEVGDREDDVTLLRHDLALMERRAEKATAQLHDALDEQVKLIKERDEALRTVQEVLDSHDETLRDIASGKFAAEPRPLTPDDITDEMVERARKRGSELVGALWDREVIEAMLTAALTVPTRPEGAEEIEAILAGSWPMDREGLSAAADDLATNGVRVDGNRR